MLVGPEIFWVGYDIDVDVGSLAGLEVFGLESFGGDLRLADDDAVFGEFGGVGEFVAEFFAGKDDGGAVAFGTEFVGDIDAFVVFVLGHWNDSVI